MQKILLSFITLTFLHSGVLNAQSNRETYIEDFEGGQGTTKLVEIKSLTGDWQKGMPVKSPFGSGFDNSKHAVVTDTANPYSKPKSQMIVSLKRKLKGTDLNFNFKHKLDIVDNVDSASIEVSFDKGLNWLNQQQASDYVSCNAFRMTGSQWKYTESIPTWESFEMGVIFGVVLRMEGCTSTSLWQNLDTLLFRFNFYNISKTNTKAGWIIDNIGIENKFVGGLEDDYNSLLNLTISPNPSDNQSIRIDSKQSGNYIKEWTLIAPEGNVISRSDKGGISEIETENLKKGIYVVKILTSTGQAYRKLVIR